MALARLGDFVFNVDSNRVLTFEELPIKESVKWYAHQVIGGGVVYEYGGLEESLTKMNIVLSAFRGVNPLEQLEQLQSMMKAHKPVKFFLHKCYFGKWVLKSVNSTFKRIDRNGIPFQIDVELELLRVEGPKKVPLK